MFVYISYYVYVYVYQMQKSVNVNNRVNENRGTVSSIFKTNETNQHLFNNVKENENCYIFGKNIFFKWESKVSISKKNIISQLLLHKSEM